MLVKHKPHIDDKNFKPIRSFSLRLSLSLLSLLLLYKRKHPDLDSSQPLAFILDDLLQLSEPLLDENDLAIVEFCCFFGSPLHEEASSVLNQIHLILLHKIK